MPWPDVIQKTPTELGSIEMRIKTSASDAADATYSGMITVEDQTGAVMETIFINLVDSASALNTGQQTQLRVILKSIWADAVEELLS